MQVLVLGAGGIGGYFGGRMAAAGVDVRFLVRPARAEVLTRSGLVIRSPLGDLDIPVEALTKPSVAFDAVVLACKSYDLDSAMDAIAPAVGADTLILPLLNGIGHLDALDARFGEEHVLGGLCHIGVTMAPSGEILHLNRLQRLTLGARTEQQRAGARRLHELLARGGFEPVLSDVIMQELWEKFVFLATYAGMTTLMRTTVGAISSTDEGDAITREMLDECISVAAAEGYFPRPPARAEMIASLTDKRSTGTASMLRDMTGNRQTEHDHIIGDMLVRARGAGLPAPLLRVSLANMQAYAATRPDAGA
ncbi:ketopantoate reductase family protein [Acidovorax sp. SDU_ACID1]|uniref:ketopantoate reductase family protein n=1 Tax=Acidovorax sp. SDU_ACID1 TaxID=3136632 RepID=UPI00387311F3